MRTLYVHLFWIAWAWLAACITVICSCQSFSVTLYVALPGKLNFVDAINGARDRQLPLLGCQDT